MQNLFLSSHSIGGSLALFVLYSAHVFFISQPYSSICGFISHKEMAESLHHLDLLLQLQTESFQETLEAHVSGFWSPIFSLYYWLPIIKTGFSLLPKDCYYLPFLTLFFLLRDGQSMTLAPQRHCCYFVVTKIA